MNRIVIFEKNGEVMAQREHLSKQPSGNGDQRRKQIRNGWQPEWVRESAPQKMQEKGLPVIAADIRIYAMGMQPVPPEIAAALKLAAAWVLDESQPQKAPETFFTPIRFVPHTCIERPHLPCDNPYCTHRPVE